MYREKAFQKYLNYHPNIIIYTALTVAALLLSIPLSLGSIIPFIVYIGLIYIFLLFKRPEIGFAISFFIIIGFLGIMGRSFLRVEGYFKLLDIALVVLFLSFVKEVFYQSDLRFLIKSPIAKALLLFMGSAIAAGIYTKVHYNISIISIIQAGRVYLFYSLFFLSLYHIRGKKQLHLFLKILLGSAILFSILYIAQHLIGKSLKIFVSGAQVKIMNIGEYSIWRLRITSIDFPGLFLPCMLGIILLTSCKKIRYWATIVASLFIVQIIFTLGRAHWFGVVISCLVFWLFLPLSKKISILKYLTVVTLIIIFLLPIISLLMYDSPFPLFSLIIDRSDTGIKDFYKKSGTFGWRYDIAERYWDLLKRRPIFGFGLIPLHSEDIIANLPGKMARDPHVGILNIFIDLGLVGSLFFVILVVVVIIRSLYIYRNLHNQFYKVVSLGILSAFIGRVAAFTLDIFSTYEQVTMIAVMLGLLEIMYIVDNEDKSSKKLEADGQIKSAL